MCGIVGFIGEQPAAPILLEGLSKLVNYQRNPTTYRLL